MIFNFRGIFWAVIFLLILIASVFAYFYFNQSQETDRMIRVLDRGVHEFPDGLKVPENEILVIEPGAVLVMGERSKIEIKGRIIAKGTEEKPIVFRGNNAYWRGIEITGQNTAPDREEYKKLLETRQFEESDYFKALKNGNIFIYCHFENLKTDGKLSKENRVRAVIEANYTALIVSHSVFKDIIHIGGVQTNRSILLAGHNYTNAKYIMKMFHLMESIHITHDNELRPDRHECRTWPEGIYTKGGLAVVVNNIVQGFPDNGIDNDQAISYIINNHVKEVYDDGIDIDHETEAYVIGNKIESAKFDGIVVSNQSSAVLINNQITGTDTGIALRNGGRVIAENIDISEAQNGIMLFNQVPLFIEKNDYFYVKERFRNLSHEDFTFHDPFFGFYVIKDGEDAVKLLEESYDNYNNLFVLNQPRIPHDLRSLFKTIDIFMLEEITDIPTEIDEETIDNLIRHHNQIQIKNYRIAAENDFTVNSFFSIKSPYFEKEKAIKPDALKFPNSDDIIKEAMATKDYILELVKGVEVFIYEL